jgi:hypothetical protein
MDEALLKQNGLTGSVLAKSSAQAWEQRNFFMISPQFIQPPQANQLRQFNLIAAVAGKFPSNYQLDKLPAPSRKGDTLPPFVSEPKPARILIIGGADLITNDFINSRSADQLVRFVQNAIDWVAQDPALIEIRNKGLEAAALANVADAHREAIKYFNVIGLPLLVVAFGFMLWRRQRAWRTSIAAMFKD